MGIEDKLGIASARCKITYDEKEKARVEWKKACEEWEKARAELRQTHKEWVRTGVEWEKPRAEWKITYVSMPEKDSTLVVGFDSDGKLISAERVSK